MLATHTQYRSSLLQGKGHYGPYGGAYVPEVLRPNMERVAAGFAALQDDAAFAHELQQAYQHFSGRPTPLLPLSRLSDSLGGAQLYLKNEGQNLTGAHKITHCLGQILLAKQLGYTRIIAETGAGQHGYATATVCARYGMPCTIYMGSKDYARQRPNVYWMTLLGAQVVPVDGVSGTLNDAVIAALQDLTTHPDDTYYLLGSAVGPHPYPMMNTFFQSVVGAEVRQQMDAQIGRAPDACYACVGGGSNALGLFYEFLDEPSVQLLGVEAGGTGSAPGAHAAKMQAAEPGVFEGYASYFLQDDVGNIAATHSIAAGLDYCGISPILAYLYDEGRVQFATATDDEALAAIGTLARTEGIILALESAHALAAALRDAPNLSPDTHIVLNGSGRGEKDLFITMPQLQPEAFVTYLQQQLDAHNAPH